jgi:restriction endonuclease Mrr
MSIPDYQSLMLPVLKASAKGEVRIGPVAEELANQLGLSPEERNELLPSGKQTVITNRAHWAKLYLPSIWTKQFISNPPQFSSATTSQAHTNAERLWAMEASSKYGERE